MTDSRAPETRCASVSGDKTCSRTAGHGGFHQYGYLSWSVADDAPSDPPVGKDSSFEELLKTLERIAFGEPFYSDYAGETIHEFQKRHNEWESSYAAARSALSRYVTKQREEIERLKVIFGDDLEYWTNRAKKAESELEAALDGAKEYERERNEAVERQRETTLTPEEAEHIQLARYNAMGALWGTATNPLDLSIFAKCARVRMSSPLTRGTDK